MISHITSHWNPTQLSVDVVMRIVGSILVITAYFVILHIDVTTGVIINLTADIISVPYFIRTKSWDVVVMLSFISAIGISKLMA
jgi:hypothetical protein